MEMSLQGGVVEMSLQGGAMFTNIPCNMHIADQHSNQAVSSFQGSEYKHGVGGGDDVRI
jgi:hypothetical protein